VLVDVLCSVLFCFVSILPAIVVGVSPCIKPIRFDYKWRRWRSARGSPMPWSSAWNTLVQRNPTPHHRQRRRWRITAATYTQANQFTSTIPYNLRWRQCVHFDEGCNQPTDGNPPGRPRREIWSPVPGPQLLLWSPPIHQQTRRPVLASNLQQQQHQDTTARIAEAKRALISTNAMPLAPVRWNLSLRPPSTMTILPLY